MNNASSYALKGEAPIENDYAKIKIGVKTLDDAILNLGTLEK